MTRSLTGLAGTLRASRDRRNRLAGERAARLVADGAARDDNSDDSCSLNHDRYNAEAAPCPLLAVWWSGSRGGGGGGVLVERLQAGRRSPVIHRQRPGTDRNCPVAIGGSRQSIRLSHNENRQ